MWLLEAYDRLSEQLTATYPLPQLSGSAVRALIVVDESELPVEVGPHPVPLEVVAEFARFATESVTIEPQWDYFVGLFAD